MKVHQLHGVCVCVGGGGGGGYPLVFFYLINLLLPLEVDDPPWKISGNVYA